MASKNDRFTVKTSGEENHAGKLEKGQHTETRIIRLLAQAV